MKSWGQSVHSKPISNLFFLKKKPNKNQQKTTFWKSLALKSPPFATTSTSKPPEAISSASTSTVRDLCGRAPPGKSTSLRHLESELRVGGWSVVFLGLESDLLVDSKKRKRKAEDLCENFSKFANSSTIRRNRWFFSGLLIQTRFKQTFQRHLNWWLTKPSWFRWSGKTPIDAPVHSLTRRQKTHTPLHGFRTNNKTHFSHSLSTS